jgi:hypothetical protein
VIRLGLRLTLRGGREAAIRLVVTAAAVALGASLLLITLAGINAVNHQNVRYSWLNSGAAASAHSSGPAGGTAGAGRTAARDRLWWWLRADYFGPQLIGRIDVAVAGPRAPVPPGIPRLPGPGQYYASPALSQLIRSHPGAQLGNRFPGHQVGTIGPAALPAPNTLLVIVGRAPAQLSGQPGAVQVSSVRGTSPSGCSADDCELGVGINANGIDLVLSVVSAALLFPVLIFIAAATRLSAARREQRFAAMRLAGAAPRQVSVIAAVESTVATVTGVAAGFGLFFLLRPAVAAIPFTGAPFFTSDLSLSAADIALVAVGVPVAGVIAARLALRRVQISPLGVSRRVTPRAPRAWRLLPLLAGVLELVSWVFIGRPHGTPGQLAAYVPGFLLILAGLISAGPWLTMIGARVVARRARRPATLIAGRRLADRPGAGFRAISGLALALFVTSVTVGVITTISAYRGPNSVGAAAAGTLVDQFTGPGTDRSAPVPAPSAALFSRLRAVAGVHGVTLVHINPLGTSVPSTKVGLPAVFGPLPSGLVSCSQLARTPTIGRCRPGAVAAAVAAHVLLGVPRAPASITWDPVDIPAQRLAQLPVESIVVTTSGSVAAVEQARTVLEAAYPGLEPPRTLRELASPPGSDLTGWQQLATVVIITSLVIAGCSLAVSVAGGLSDRKRPFSLLRLTGTPLHVLRSVVALESAVPLLLVALVATGTGFLAAQLFLAAQFHYTLLSPGTGYYVSVAGGLAASLAVIASTLPLLSRITGPETARNE